MPKIENVKNVFLWKIIKNVKKHLIENVVDKLTNIFKPNEKNSPVKLLSQFSVL